MSQTFKARPTEYKGIKFRSKSEAMFARWLELWLEDREKQFRKDRWSIGEGSGGFIYEPDLLFRQRLPDFLAWQVVRCSVIPEVFIWIIEYKPSRPTKAYCEQFLNDVRGVAGRMNLMGCFVYYGSHWNTDRGIVSSSALCDDPWETLKWEEVDWLSKYESQVMETRFDLVND